MSSVAPAAAAAPRELTLRALLTGALLGVLLTPSNVYAGLKIGWSFNMSIIALLLGYGLWQGLASRGGGVPWSLHESNINQTTASAAASIISGGLVAPIPAYTLLTGQSLPPLPLMAWVFSVSFLGVWVAWFLRPSLVADRQLAFPEGMATLETLRQVYSQGREAARRLRVLFGAAACAAGVKAVDLWVWALPRWAPGPALERLTFALDPSLLLLGFGAIVGLRVGLTLLAGALLAWGVVAPVLLAHGAVLLPAGASGPQFDRLVAWLLWPGVSLMVCATLTSLALALWRDRRRAASGKEEVVPGAASPLPHPHLPPHAHRLPLVALALAAAAVVALQRALFGIPLALALLTLPLAVFLAAVAARIVGATGIPPIGAIGQLTQLGFGVAAPGQVAVNLMGANTAGGAAGQCTDLMNDFRVGHAIGARPLHQAASQCIGIAVGSVVGVLAYRALIPDPAAQLLTAEWPAPAVATWKAVAQAMAGGGSSLSAGVKAAMGAGAAAGVLLAVAEARLPAAAARRLPSAGALGLAFVLPASVSLTMAAGAVIVALAGRRWPAAVLTFGITAAAGLIAGESITGVVAAMVSLAGEGRR